MKRILCAVILLWINPASEAVSQSASTIALRGKTQQLQIYGNDRGNPAILTSGDLGWAGLVVHVAEFLSAQGYHVLGFNSRAYLASFTTKDASLDPRDVPRDFQTLIDLIRQKSMVKPVLIGISEGAGLSVLAATDPQVKSAVQGVLGLGLPDQIELGWRLLDSITWITKKNPDEPRFMVGDAIQRVSPTPLAEIHSTHDEFLPLKQAQAMFARAGEPKKMWVIEAANHRFSNSRDELDRRILEALEWIKVQK